MAQYPYTNFHDYNLDWILDQIKTMLAEWVSTRTDWNTMQEDNTALRAEWTQFQADINTWLDTNVPLEIADRLHVMVNNGSIFNIIYEGTTEYPEPIKTAVENYLSTHYSQGYTVDPNLNTAGAAADAKATGDAVRVNVPIYLGRWEYGHWNPPSGGSGGSSRRDEIRMAKPAYNAFAIPLKITFTVPEGYKAYLLYYTPDNQYQVALAAGYATGTYSYTFSASTTMFLFYMVNVAGETIGPEIGNRLLVTYEEPINVYLTKQFKTIHASDISFSTFVRFGVIGDSWAWGNVHRPDANGGNFTNHNISWTQVLARTTGTIETSFAFNGAGTQSWLSDPRGLTAMLNADAQPLYIIALGHNDADAIAAGTYPLGSLPDINLEDFTQNPNTFYGNYGRIIGNIKYSKPNAKIICLSVMDLDHRALDADIAAIANKCEVVFIDLSQEEYFNSRVFVTGRYDYHPNSAFTFGGIANAVNRAICKKIASEPYYWLSFGSVTNP